MEQQTPRRPNRNFPMAFQIIPATRFSEGTCKLVSVADLHPSERQYHPSDHREREHNPDLVYANVNTNVNADASAPLPATPSPAANLPAEEGPAATAPAEIKPAQPKPDPSHHGRRCAICNHPNREAIEGDFLNWRSPEMIAREFNIRDRASVYRHAGAFNLYAQRKRQLGRVLENIIECSDLCTFDHCDMIIRAARVYAHLDDDGKWHEPPRTHYIFTSRVMSLPAGTAVVEEGLPAMSKNARRKKPERRRGGAAADACPPKRDARRRVALAKSESASQEKPNRNSPQFKKRLTP